MIYMQCMFAKKNYLEGHAPESEPLQPEKEFTREEAQVQSENVTGLLGQELLVPIQPPVLSTPVISNKIATKKKERSQLLPIKHSARLAAQPKTNLTMEDQATALLIRKSGVLFTGAAPNNAAHAEFRGKFTEPLKHDAMGGFNDMFGLEEGVMGDDFLAPIALEGAA
jgi:hypothetical protein